MRSRSLFTVLLAGAVAGACADSSTPVAPQTINVPVQFETGSHAPAEVPHNYRTHLTGDEEVPTPTGSKAQGQAIFQISADGTEIRYRLTVANIENVTQAHIHCCAPMGSNAGVVAWLYPSGPPAQLIPGRSQGTIGEGVITQSSLVGGLAGQPLSALIDAIVDGNAYVNVHTSQFPPGEIRGQID